MSKKDIASRLLALARAYCPLVAGTARRGSTLSDDMF